jgi:hypothetical protein
VSELMARDSIAVECMSGLCVLELLRRCISAEGSTDIVRVFYS